MGSLHGFLTAQRAHEPGRDGALRRPRRVQRRNGSARYCVGGDIAARCPYLSTVHGKSAVTNGAQILVGGSSWEIRIATAARFRYTVTVTTPWERPWDGAHRRR